MAEHKVGNMVVLTGTIVAIHDGVALVEVQRAFPPGGTVAVRLGTLPDKAPMADEMATARIRRAVDRPR